MSRIFWDAMLFIYVLEGHPKFGRHALRVLDRCQERGDLLLTSNLAVGEVMAGGENEQEMEQYRSRILGLGFSFVGFDDDCSLPFAKLRGEAKLKAPDAIHLACAAAAGVDMFLTGDDEILRRRLHVPGIQFIADFTLPIL
jgi:uncharacterized protein